ncbi:MAG TPA: hypothetical protein VMV50_00500 [Candidatus Paceibacterota bacterium]|nr:hypothetical protein [Candidatus Paceibacterota bacterium]
MMTSSFGCDRCRNAIRCGGSITLLVLVFGAIFLIVLTALSGYILSQNRIENVDRIKAEAFNIADAGLEYYRWHLAHFPTDLTNGTGGPGPYPVTIPDPQGGTAGTATLSITANTACSQTTSIDITSVGTAAEDPSQPVTLVARYARPSIASYDIVTNNAIWFGSDEIINGPVHSNNGIHEDGPNNAPVTSSVSTWSCPSSLGCHGETENGVFGNGTNPNLWKFPVPQVDFAGIATDFSSLKTIAQSNGIYLPRYSSGNSNGTAYYKGYHLVFNAPDGAYPNGSVTITKVMPGKVSNVYLLDTSSYGTEYSLISNEAPYETVGIPSNCGLIFVEDNAWIEGTIPGKVTVVVANVSNSGVVPEAYLRGNIEYATSDGSDGFTLIAQHDVLITPDSPQNLTLDGVYIAQTGSFGRNLYAFTSQGCNGVYEPRNAFSIHGTIVASLYENETWVIGQSCGSEQNAGYQTTDNYPDQALASNPPPFTPALSTDYEFVNWLQKQ